MKEKKWVSKLLLPLVCRLQSSPRAWQWDRPTRGCRFWPVNQKSIPAAPSSTFPLKIARVARKEVAKTGTMRAVRSTNVWASFCGAFANMQRGWKVAWQGREGGNMQTSEVSVASPQIGRYFCHQQVSFWLPINPDAQGSLALGSCAEAPWHSILSKLSRPQSCTI